MIAAYRHLEHARPVLYRVLQGKDRQLILRRIHDWRVQTLEASLRTAFAEAESTIPLDVLANYLAGAHTALVQAWLENRQTRALEDLAQTVHSLQRAAIREAFGLGDGE